MSRARQSVLKMSCVFVEVLLLYMCEHKMNICSLFTQNTIKQSIMLFTADCKVKLTESNPVKQVYEKYFKPILSSFDYKGASVEGMSGSVFQEDASRMFVNFCTSLKTNFASRTRKWIKMQLENHLPSFKTQVKYYRDTTILVHGKR